MANEDKKTYAQMFRKILDKPEKEDAKAETEAPENPRGPVRTRRTQAQEISKAEAEAAADAAAKGTPAPAPDNQESRVGIGGFGSMAGTSAAQGTRLDDPEFQARAGYGIARREQLTHVDPNTGERVQGSALDRGRAADPNFFLEEEPLRLEDDIAANVEEAAQTPEFTPGRGGWSYRDDGENIIAKKADGSVFKVTPTTKNARGNIYDAIRAEQQSMSAASPAPAAAAPVAAPVQAPVAPVTEAAEAPAQPSVQEALAGAGVPDRDRIAQLIAEQEASTASTLVNPEPGRLRQARTATPIPSEEMAERDRIAQLIAEQEASTASTLVNPEPGRLRQARTATPQPLTMASGEIGSQESTPDLDQADRILVRNAIQRIIGSGPLNTSIEDMVSGLTPNEREQLAQIQIGGKPIGKMALEMGE